MRIAPPRALLLIAALLLLTVVTGCKGPLELTYAPTTVAEPVRLSTPPASIFVDNFKDVRETGNTMSIGTISATVSDMNETELILSTEPALTLRNAFIQELTASGFTVLEGPAKATSNAQYVLSGELRELTLDIGSRDAIAVEAYIELKENSSGSVAWSGVLREAGDRYAGVMGNSRASINRYLSNSIASLVRSTIAAFSPALFNTAPSKQQITTESGSEITASPETGPAKGTGKSDSTLVIESEPEGAKVYIDDVYWGTTPLTINFYPGTYELRLKKKGYKIEKEKVGLKRGRTTQYKTELIKKESTR